MKEQQDTDAGLLLYNSGNSGGARPKAIFHDDEGHWLVKFRHTYDPHDIGQQEYHYNEVARRCGIRVPDFKLMNGQYFTENILYNKLLNDKLSSNLGYLYENMVAQMLVCSGNKLFYHTWPTESGKHNYEIDFLLSRDTKIVPVEVKSSTYKTHVSMDEFCKKFSSRIANDRYLVYTKNYFKEGAMKYLPAYLAYFL